MRLPRKLETRANLLDILTIPPHQVDPPKTPAEKRQRPRPEDTINGDPKFTQLDKLITTLTDVREHGTTITLNPDTLATNLIRPGENLPTLTQFRNTVITLYTRGTHHGRHCIYAHQRSTKQNTPGSH